MCITGQHRELLDEVLEIFSIKPHYDLHVMRPNHDLIDLTARTIVGMKSVITNEKPDWVLVQGDTTSAMAATLAAFYSQTRVGHVEAGLRSHEKAAPFPEEGNRKIIDALADRYFVPTETSRNNLLREGVLEKDIIVSGNTVIDALLWVAHRIANHSQSLEGLESIDWEKRMILVTGHRRESFGYDIRTICYSLLRLAKLRPEINIVYPVHLNPNIQSPVYEILGDAQNIYLLPPQNYEDFVWLMTKAYLILTDSGGVQEEGPALGKPVLVMRRVTDRPEGITAGVAKLTGIELEAIVSHATVLLEDETEYARMAQATNPYGDGHAAERIVEGLSC